MSNKDKNKERLADCIANRLDVSPSQQLGYALWGMAQDTTDLTADLEILNAIGDTPKTYTQIQAYTTLRLPEIFRGLDRLAEQGRIQHVGDGKWVSKKLKK